MRRQFKVSLIEDIAIEILEDPHFQTKLAVRSSSSMEDLPGQSGAGLYDSVIGVEPTSRAVKAAIEQVFLSLYTKRAVMSRLN